MLRPDLHRRLDRHPLLGGVWLANDDIPAEFYKVIENGKMCSRVSSRGEEYRVNCPFCKESRHRLYVSHFWGMEDPIDGRRRWDMCHCYNNNCMNEFENRNRLRFMIYDDALPPKKADKLEPIVKKQKSGPEAVPLPGTCYPVQNLPEGHICSEYLKSRGFLEIAECMQLHYCAWAPDPYSQASDRLVIPIYMNGMLQSWQARRLVDEDDPFTSPAKYYTCPGTHKSQLLYSHDIGRRYGNTTIVVVEGPTDVWRFGPGSVATLGKGASPQQQAMIRNFWSAALFIADGNDPDSAVKASNAVRAIRMNSGKAAFVSTPAGVDPGGMSVGDLHALVGAAAQSQALPPPFFGEWNFGKLK